MKQNTVLVAAWISTAAAVIISVYMTGDTFTLWALIMPAILSVMISE